MSRVPDGAGGLVATDPPPFDPTDPLVLADPYPAYAWLRRHRPIAHLPDFDVWLVARHRDAQAVLRDPATFSSRIGMSRDLAPATSGTGVDYRIGAPRVRVLLATDPPEHQQFRQALAGAFAPSTMAVVAPGVTALADRLVEDLRRASADGPVDACSGLAEQLPVQVLADLFGLPASAHADLRAWATMITADLEQRPRPTGTVGRGLDMFRYFSRLLRNGRPPPGPLHSILEARRHGLSDHEVLAFCAFLLVAGVETTTNLLTNTIAVLVRLPTVQERLRRYPDLVPAAVEEAIRYDTPVQALWRGTTRDVVLGGHAIPAGARILVLFGSANRDEAVFRDPASFRLDRRPNDHLGFGAGPHFCLGARLARMEVAAAVRSLLRSSRWLAAAGPAERTASVVLRGLTRLPVRLYPR